MFNVQDIRMTATKLTKRQKKKRRVEVYWPEGYVDPLNQTNTEKGKETQKKERKTKAHVDPSAPILHIQKRQKFRALPDRHIFPGPLLLVHLQRTERTAAGHLYQW